MSTNDARTYGRCYEAKVHGDTTDELEIAALGEAAEFFGAGVQLEIRPRYAVRRSNKLDRTDKTYTAFVDVREVLV